MLHTTKSMYLDITGRRKPPVRGRITEAVETDDIDKKSGNGLEEKSAGEKL